MKILAVDYGDARTGLACCDRTEFLASPVGVIESHVFDETLRQVAAAAVEFEAGEIIVGYPLNMNGSRGPRARLCEQFAKKLGSIVSVPVRLWDERSTTVSAIGYLNTTNTRGKKRKAVVDAVAATILLETYMTYKKGGGQLPQAQNDDDGNGEEQNGL